VLNIDVAAPMPSATINIAMTVNPGDFRRERKA
jgi:hypothetical protein